METALPVIGVSAIAVVVVSILLFARRASRARAAGTRRGYASDSTCYGAGSSASRDGCDDGSGSNDCGGDGGGGGD